MFRFVSWYKIQVKISQVKIDAVKPVCNDHLYHKIYYMWFIQ